MASRIRVHYDNPFGFDEPHLWVWSDGSLVRSDVAPTERDDFGHVYDVTVVRQEFHFKFKNGPGTAGRWEPASLDRSYRPLERRDDALVPDEVWCTGNAFVYHVESTGTEPESSEAFLGRLHLTPGTYIPETGAVSGLGASRLVDGRTLFGLYHPNAARVYVMGGFNGWQRPGHDRPDSDRFIELKRHRGYFGLPNVWLAVSDRPAVGDEYKFFVQGGVPRDDTDRFQRSVTDPYARQLGSNLGVNNAVVVDPSAFRWGDAGWVTPDPDRLILYEMSVYGFTEADPDITPSSRGRFKGVTERIEAQYFNRLGVNALSLMPLAEVPTPQGPAALGYNPTLFATVERDFGSPDDLRQLVDAAHRKGIAVLLDQVFNHTSNDPNPLWKAVLEHPGEELDAAEGGLYFSGGTPWGNRVASEKADVQNLLIDACKLLLKEYHVDGFRFDATHSAYMDHGFLERLAGELKAFRPGVLLVAENLPNEADLNRRGFDGYAQWCNPFHDKVKALLRESQYEGQSNGADNLGDIFYFSKSSFASHTNNVVNYCYSHDEHSVPAELNFTSMRNDLAAKDRKGRLGLFATLVALGQPMLYMGQEFNLEQERNVVTVDWPPDLDAHGFFQWTSRLIRLRGRYPGLRLRGYDPAETGQFAWILGPWMVPDRGGGQKVVGWRARPNEFAHDAIVVMLNFENHDVEVEVDFGIPGVWLKLADIDRVNDLPPNGTNSVGDPAALRAGDGRFGGFTLPGSSGFIYKWEAR